jgi:prepilin-type N-terminal cleavage/methylation domain-containing protein
MKNLNKRGFTFIEAIIAIAIVAVIGVMATVNYSRQRPIRDFESSKLRIVAVLREASTRSISQSEGVAWGVRFQANSATSSFFTLFAGNYAGGSISQFSALPFSIRFDTTTFTGTSKEVTFSKIDGRANASTSVRIYIVSDVSKSSTIKISSSGLVTF